MNTKAGKVKILFRCEICHKEFLSRPNSILQGAGCPFCNKSKAERVIANILENENINFKSEIAFKNFKSPKNGYYRFDFQINLDEKNNILLEFDGYQHFFSTGHFTEEKIKEIQNSDKAKNEYCLNHNIKLMRIPFTHFKKLYQIIKDLIKTKDVPLDFLVDDINGSLLTREILSNPEIYKKNE